MALIIEGGISIGGNITITASSGISPTANLIIFYDAGNSMSYNGGGSTFDTNTTGQLVTGYYANVVVDLSILSGGLGNAGNLTAESGNTATWTSQGVASYCSFDAASNQYIDSGWQAGNAGDNNVPVLNSPTYTILSVVRPKDFTQGAIVGGDQNVFTFVPTGGANSGPTVMASNSYSGAPAVIDTTTEFATNTWYCVAVTYDAGTGVMKLYTNGNLVATANTGAINHPTGLYWGTLEGQLWLTGDLAVGMVWERVVDAAQISQLSTAFLSRYVSPAATSSVVYTQPYLGGPAPTFTVPEGVTSISVVVVGGGGSGTATSYSAPGSDSGLLRIDNSVSVDTNQTGTGNTIVVSTSDYPNIANVSGDSTWLVLGSDIPSPSNTIPGWDLVTSIDTSSSPGNAIITINNSISTTAGDQFFFYQAVAAAEGGYEITDSSYSGPAPQPLVGDGGGAGGLVDPTESWPIGGGGAGGYGGAGGQGTANNSFNATAGQGGGGGGGGGRQEDSGAGGGGTDIYGQGNNGAAGTFDSIVGNNTIALGGSGGSQQFAVDGNGGQATAWNGGRGGWPGGGGASATGYWDGGLGGALAYRNNYAVTAGEQYLVLVGVGGLGQTDGGSGADGAVRIVWPGDTRQFPSTGVGVDTVSIPTLDITAHNFPLGNPSGQITFDITNTGNSTILEAGVIFGLPGQTTYSLSEDTCVGYSSTAERTAIRAGNNCSNPPTTGLTGSQTVNFNANEFVTEDINVLAYARNAAGVAYSPTVLTWHPTICLAEGTLITLADGSTKAIENIAMNDSIRVWDFDTAAATSATPLWIKRQESTTQYNLIKFSDGSELKTVSQHRIFNKEAGAFTYPMTDATPIGTTTVRADGAEVTVVSKKVVYERVNYYNVVTAGGYMNLYANGILTSLRFNNIYPIADMRYTKDGRALRPTTEFSAAGISDRWIAGLRLPEQTTALDELKKYIARMERNEKTAIPAGKPPSWRK